jgi:hypothetical protein
MRSFRLPMGPTEPPTDVPPAQAEAAGIRDLRDALCAKSTPGLDLSLTPLDQF